MSAARVPEKERKHLKKSILALLILLVIFAAAIWATEAQIYKREIRKEQSKSTEGIRQTLEMFETNAREVGNWFYRDLNAAVRIMTLALRDDMKDGVYTGPQILSEGFVVRIQNGKAEIPAKAADRFPALTAEMVTREYTQFRIRDEAPEDPSAKAAEVIVTAGNIGGDWYYVDCTPSSEYAQYYTSQVSLSRIVDTIGDAYEGELFLVSSAEKDGKFILNTPGLNAFRSIGDLGLTMEDLTEEPFEVTLPSRGTLAFFCVPMPSMEIIAVYGEETTSLTAQSTNRIITMTFIAAISLSVLLTWAVNVRRFTAMRKLTAEQKIRYAPSQVRKLTIRLGILAAVLTLLAGFFIRALQFTHHLNETAAGIFDALELQIDAETERASRTRQEETDWYIYFGNTLASLIRDDPSLMEMEKLAVISDDIQADFIIIFDDTGRQIACSRDYINFVLPSDETEPTSDFRRILKGITSVVHDPELNSLTGETHQMIGVRFPMPEHPDRYGVLIIAVQENVIMQARLDDVRKRIYPRLISSDEILAEIDTEKKTVVSSSREAWVGKTARDLGIPETSLQDKHMDFFGFDGIPWYGVSRAFNGSLFYLMQNQSGIFLASLIYGLIAAAILSLFWWVMARILFHGYTHQTFVEAQGAAGAAPPEADPDRALKNVLRRWNRQLPEQRANTVFQLMLGLLMLYLLLSSSGQGPLAQNAVLAFVFSGDWARGLNLFSITACVAVVCLAVFCWILMKLLFRLLSNVISHKGETLCRLAENLLEYVIVITALFYILSFCGVDTTTLLASVGLLGMAVSLGARDLMADILAGISIIFENDYQVGDIVSVNNFRGVVQEIGVRSMKIRSDDNNVLIVNNHEIHNVINMSRYTSTFSADFDVPLSVSASDLETLMARELPAVGASVPELTGAPVYKGITAIKRGTMTITISAECREKDLSKVRHKMNRALKALFEKENIPIS